MKGCDLFLCGLSSDPLFQRCKSSERGKKSFRNYFPEFSKETAPFRLIGSLSFLLRQTKINELNPFDIHKRSFMHANSQKKFLLVGVVIVSRLVSGTLADAEEKFRPSSRLADSVLKGEKIPESILTNPSLMSRDQELAEQPKWIPPEETNEAIPFPRRSTGTEIVEHAQQTATSFKQLLCRTFEFLAFNRLILPVCLLVMCLSVWIKKIPGR